MRSYHPGSAIFASLVLAAAGLLGSAALVPRQARAIDPYHYGGGEPLPGGRDEEACWSEEEDLEGWVISSNVVSQFGLESEIANDFVIDHDATIIQARWVGGYYCFVPGDPLLSSFNLRFYDDAGCVPGAVIAEIIIPNNANETFVDDQDGCAWLCSYWYDIEVPVSAGVMYWFGAQGGDHAFPPQWGRLSTLEIIGCQSRFKSAFFGYPDWTLIEDMEGIDVAKDFHQEFVCGEPVAAIPRTWGSIKSLYE
jgi:hypothetical protein